MVMVLAVTLLLSYIILTLLIYNRNLSTLESEVRQEAKYIQGGDQYIGISVYGGDGRRRLVDPRYTDR